MYSPARLGVKGDIVATALVVTINLEVWSEGVHMSERKGTYNIMEHLRVGVKRRVEEADCRLPGLETSFVDLEVWLGRL